MKPTIQFNTRRGPRLPKTDYAYQSSPAASMGGRCFGSPRPSFRSISKDYFNYEAPQSFATEAALFSVIVMTAAVSLISSVAGMVHLVRAFAV
ncbi:MAG TPA: hypothetical protein VEX43_17090 [Chthoniobacterales bacterium]|nr:hypothetical protein [Chthoniobacterales bacterium]